MIKKTIALISAFATVFAFAACGKLEEDAGTTKKGITNNITDLFVKDENGMTVPVVTKLDGDKVIYEYTDSEGNKVTVENPDDIISVTKFSSEQIENIEEISKMFEDAPEDTLAESDVNLELSEGLIPEDKFVETEVELGENGKPIREETKKYEEIFTKGSFTFRVKVATNIDGVKNTAPISCYKNGDNMLFEFVGPVLDPSKPVRCSFLYKDKSCYLIIPSMRSYYKLPGEMAAEMFNFEDFDQAIGENTGTESNGDYVASYTVTLNGKKYECDVYEDKASGTVSKMYYNENGTIVRTEVIDGEDSVIWEILEISEKCDNTHFSIPDGLIDGSAFLEMYS